MTRPAPNRCNRHCEQSEAIQTKGSRRLLSLDCFALPAMTMEAGSKLAIITFSVIPLYSRSIKQQKLLVNQSHPLKSRVGLNPAHRNEAPKRDLPAHSGRSPIGSGESHKMAPNPLIRFPGDHLGLAIFGHQWKPARLLIFSRSLARTAHRIEMISSRASSVGMCLLTTGSSTSVQSVSAGCTSGV